MRSELLDERESQTLSVGAYCVELWREEGRLVTVMRVLERNIVEGGMLVFIMCDTDQAITWNKNCVMSWPGRTGRNKEKITSCSSLTRRVPDNGRTWTREGGRQHTVLHITPHTPC